MKIDRSKATLAASVGGVLVGGTVVGILMLSGTGNASPSPSESVTPAAATTSDVPTTVVPVSAAPTATPPPAVASTSPVVAHSSVTVKAPQVQQEETTPVTETTPVGQPNIETSTPSGPDTHAKPSPRGNPESTYSVAYPSDALSPEPQG